GSSPSCRAGRATTRPTVSPAPVAEPDSLIAAWFGTQPSSATAAMTRSRVASDTPGRLLKARDTAPRDTPARAATSVIVTRPGRRALPSFTDFSASVDAVQRRAGGLRIRLCPAGDPPRRALAGQERHTAVVGAGVRVQAVGLEQQVPYERAGRDRDQRVVDSVRADPDLVGSIGVGKLPVRAGEVHRTQIVRVGDEELSLHVTEVRDRLRQH